MNLPDFIAKRTIDAKEGSFSGSISRIAVSSIAIGLATMLISILILGGFRQKITEKIYGFTGHLQVSKYTLSNSFESSPTSRDTKFYKNWQRYDYIENVQAFAYKAGLLKAKEAIEGVIIKGVTTDFDTLNFSTNLVKGRFPNLRQEQYAKEVMISEKLAKLLSIQLNEKVLMYFVQNPPRYRQLTVVGIFSTGLEEFDDKVIIGDLALIQRLNSWDDDQVGGYEVFLKSTADHAVAEEQIYEQVDPDQFVSNTKQRHGQYFDWLDLLDQNVRVFLALILFVACFNMAAVLFILILERTNMIGLLKAVGANNGLIRRIFFFSGIRLTLKGLFYGNALALGLAAIQFYFKIIPLDAENYYMSFVPIRWNFEAILFINLLVVVLVGFALVLPTVLVTKLKPIKAIKFD